jgi:hypothetical protein
MAQVGALAYLRGVWTTLQHLVAPIAMGVLIVLSLVARAMTAFEDHWKIPRHWKLPLGKSDAQRS